MRCLPSLAVLPSLTKHQSMQWLISLLSRQLITSDTALPSSYQLFLFLNHCLFMKKKKTFPFFFFLSALWSSFASHSLQHYACKPCFPVI